MEVCGTLPKRRFYVVLDPTLTIWDDRFISSSSHLLSEDIFDRTIDC